MSEGRKTASEQGVSSAQRRRALEQANQVRSERARLKKDIATGKVGLPEILARPPACARTARVLDLLVVLPKVGPVKASRMLSRCRIADSKTLAGLTDRQRAELTNLFRADHPASHNLALPE